MGSATVPVAGFGVSPNMSALELRTFVPVKEFVHWTPSFLSEPAPPPALGALVPVTAFVEALTFVFVFGRVGAPPPT
jgi:hypothetical protein